MLSDEILKATIEGIIYVAPEPVTPETIAKSIEGEERERIKAALEDLVREYERPEHGIAIRQVAGGYRFYSKAEHHETLRRFVKSLKPPVRLSKPALETLAVIAYRQPVTLPEIEEIRGVDCGGVTHTLMEKKLVVTAGRKNVVGRPILYRTSREFLIHFGLKDVGELPSLKEFEELARQALGAPVLEEQQNDGEPTRGDTSLDNEGPGYAASLDLPSGPRNQHEKPDENGSSLNEGESDVPDETPHQP
ncbi:MAG TPA: SMC-Scp complex subunit ScpB [Terriglobia bacterium]|nr:SMC-Scp complex subunit ScpB [Terriglobia bacterium]